MQLHFALFNQISTPLRSIQPRLNWSVKTIRRDMSTSVYSQVLIHTAEWTGAMYAEAKKLFKVQYNKWQDTVSDTLNWLQATSFYGKRRRDEPVFDFYRPARPDTSLKTAADIRTCMEDHDVWRVIVARGDSTRWCPRRLDQMTTTQDHPRFSRLRSCSHWITGPLWPGFLPNNI